MASYKGTEITPGTDPQIAEQVAAIDQGLSTASMGQEKKFDLKPVKPATEAAGTLAYIGASADAFSKNLAEQAKQREQAFQNSQDQFMNALLTSQGEMGLTSTAYDQGGVNAAQSELQDINNQILAEQMSLKRRLEKLDENAQGFFGTGLQQAKDKVEAESLKKQADLSVIQLAKQGKFDSAKEIADRAVNAQLEKQRLNLEALQFNYEANKDLFTAAEQRAFETAQADRNRELDFEAYRRKAEYDKLINGTAGYNTGLAQTFEEFVASKESEKGMNIAPGTPEYVALQDEYNKQASTASVGQGLYNEFDFRTANGILSMVNKFQDEQVVKKFTSTQNALNIANQIDPNSQNPSDHQTLVYVFAKSLDPESVVREGEYATVKKYSQSTIDKYGNEIEQALQGTGFLSPGAISNMKATMQRNYEANLPQYENVRSQFERNIDQVAGRPGTGSRYLINAVGGVPAVDPNEKAFDEVVGASSGGGGFLGFLGSAFKVLSPF